MPINSPWKAPLRNAWKSLSTTMLFGCLLCCFLPNLSSADDRTVARAERPAPGTITQQALPKRASATGSLFRGLTAQETGIDFENPIDTNHPMKRLYHSGFVCGGIAVGDLNNDGKPDIFLNSGPRPNRLYLQDSKLEFRDATEAAGLAESVDKWSTGVTMVDVNNDGNLDLFICNYDSPNQLYLNQGDGTFSKPADTGLDVSDASLAASFADYDNDGDLDCYLLTNRYYRANGRPTGAPAKMQGSVAVVLKEYQQYYRIKQEGAKKFTIEEYGRADRLFRNNGDGAFEEVTEASKIAGIGHGLSMMWWDYDSDGWVDICLLYTSPSPRDRG